MSSVKNCYLASILEWRKFHVFLYVGLFSNYISKINRVICHIPFMKGMGEVKLN